MSNKSNKDLELWRKWQTTGDKKAFKQLMTDLTPLVTSFKNKHYTPSMQIPPGAFEGVLKGLTYKALKTYDPNKGTQLSTHVINHLQSSKRFIATYQNIARIPEHRVYDVGKFQRAYRTLEDRYGRPPEEKELAKHLKWKVKDVAIMSKSIRRDIAGSLFESELNTHTTPAQRYLEHAAKSALDPTDYKIYQLSMQGLSGKEMAKKLHTSTAKISRRRDHIFKVLDEYRRTVDK